jgi:hypothetical protein
MYRNKAKKKLDEAEAAYGTKNYTPLFNEGKSLLKLALPYLETYAQILEEKNPTDEKEKAMNNKQKKDAYKDIASIYAQLGMNEKYNAAKNKLDSIK